MDTSLVRADWHLFRPFDRMLKEYWGMKTQKESTCGAYSLVPMLRAMGYLRHGRNVIDEDYVASVARVNVSSNDLEEHSILRHRVESGERLPEDLQERLRRTSYRYPLLVETEKAKIGCSAQGVGYAVEVLTNEKLRAIPIAARGKRFTLGRLGMLAALVEKNIDKWDPHMVLNLKCNRLLDPSRPALMIGNLLSSAELAAKQACWDFSFGHFVAIGGFVEAEYSNGNRRTFFVMLDSFKELGFGGMHLQPIASVWKALLRGDGREGGILLIVSRQREREVSSSVSKIGLDISLWDNGSPFS